MVRKQNYTYKNVGKHKIQKFNRLFLNEYSFSPYSPICKIQKSQIFTFSLEGFPSLVSLNTVWMLLKNSEVCDFSLMSPLSELRWTFLTFNLHISEMMWLERIISFIFLIYTCSISSFHTQLMKALYSCKQSMKQK